MLKNLYGKWKNRTTYSFSDMPTGLLAFFAITGFLESGYGFVYVLAPVMPLYIETANSIPLDSWGWQGWLLTILLALFGVYAWFFGSLAWRCNNILRDRIFK